MSNVNPFAAETKVPVEKTRAEIEQLVTRCGASAFSSSWSSGGAAMIEFVAHNRVVRFTLKLPAREDKRFTRSPGGRYQLSEPQQLAAWEQACRQKWRALLLVIKAKFEAVTASISIFDDEFLAQIVDPMTGKTIAEHIVPAIVARYDKRPAILGLPAPEDGK